MSLELYGGASIMDGIIVLGLLVVLAAVAPRFGHDSRDLPRSAEARLALLGFTRERED